MKDNTQPDTLIGQIYKSERTDERYQILYVDEQSVLIRCEKSGRNGGTVDRLERRKHWEDMKDSGQFKLKPDSEIDLVNADEQNWSDVAYIGDKTNENLHDKGFSTKLDIQQANAGELMMVSGLGEQGLTNLRDYARNNE